MSGENERDPRVILKRDKYFALRPKPLERWLWQRGVAPSAERVFWLHWQEGMRNSDWCSEIPIRSVAQQCCLDVSTVTRAYQQLIRLELIRRVDPGRDTANPFQQATAVTEVRIPRDLLVELDRHPNRPQPLADRPPQHSRMRTAPSGEGNAVQPGAAPARTDLFPGLSGKERRQAMAELTSLMSARERQQFDHAQWRHDSAIDFDEPSRLGPEQRARVLQWLTICALRPASAAATQPQQRHGVPTGAHSLTLFEIARLRRQLQSLVEPAAVEERVREVVWSIEEGALRRFQSLHAMRIALKKIRDGLWSRPNRMPPNWVKSLMRSSPPQSANIAQREPCRIA
jgi:hypothetical protein